MQTEVFPEIKRVDLRESHQKRRQYYLVCNSSFLLTDLIQLSLEYLDKRSLAVSERVRRGNNRSSTKAVTLCILE